MSVLLQYSVHKDLAALTETAESITRYIVAIEAENKRLKEEVEEWKRKSMSDHAIGGETDEEDLCGRGDDGALG